MPEVQDSEHIQVVLQLSDYGTMPYLVRICHEYPKTSFSPDFYSLLKNRVYRRNKINQDSPQNTESECYAVN